MTEPEHSERIAVLETKVQSMQATLDDIKEVLDEIKPLVWKASGAVGLLVIIMNVILGLRVH